MRTFLPKCRILTQISSACISDLNLALKIIFRLLLLALLTMLPLCRSRLNRMIGAIVCPTWVRRSWRLIIKYSIRRSLRRVDPLNIFSIFSGSWKRMLLIMKCFLGILKRWWRICTRVKKKRYNSTLYSLPKQSVKISKALHRTYRNNRLAVCWEIALS